jgi:hypothetical protein
MVQIEPHPRVVTPMTVTLPRTGAGRAWAGLDFMGLLVTVVLRTARHGTDGTAGALTGKLFPPSIWTILPVIVHTRNVSI